MIHINEDVPLLVLYIFSEFSLPLCCSESGEMCAVKEVTLFSDDVKSKESTQQLGQVSFLW